MFIELAKGKQKEIINKAITKAGSERRLSKLLAIPKSSLYRYKFEINNLPEYRLHELIDFINLTRNELIITKRPSNWGQVTGGINCVINKKLKGTFQNEIANLKLISSKRMKEWHKQMKKESPERYYKIQYERFKKINGGYKYQLMDTTPVRNKLEKIVGDFLISQGIKFEYEPYFNYNGKAYFPDFKVKDTIIEVTEWTKPNIERIKKLKSKINNYQKNGFKVIFFIPKRIRKFYKAIGDFIISDLKRLKSLPR